MQKASKLADGAGVQTPGRARDSAQRRAAVSELFQEHNRLLVRYLEVRLQSHQEAKDIAQEAYVRLLSLDQPGAVGFLRAYLFKIAANLAVDRIRSRKARGRMDALEQFEEAGEPDWVEQQAAATEEVQLFWASLRELPQHYRQALVMSRLQDMPSAAIAVRMGKTDRMIRRYIAHAVVYCRLRVSGLAAADARASIDDE